MAKSTGKEKGKWSKTAFWLELAFVVVLAVLVLWHGPDRIDFVIALLVGFIWGHRLTKEPCIFKRYILRKKCNCCG